VEITVRELLRLQSKTRQIMAQHTGQTIEKIAQDFDRDVFMDAYQAKEYGIIDEVIETAAAIPGNEPATSAAGNLIAGALK
jgi:ATP-dependent Clp protease protease subunit